MAFVPEAGSAQQQPFMTVSFKMDITTSGTHNGLFITTGIQNGANTQMKGFGFIQPNNQILNNPQLAIAPAPTPTPFLAQNAPIETSTIIKEEMQEVQQKITETQEAQQKTTTSFASTSSMLNESQSIVVSPPPTQRKTTTFTAEPLISDRIDTPRSGYSSRLESHRPISQPVSSLSIPQQTLRTISPTPSFVNRTTDEFLRNVPFKINTFSEESRPFVQHPTDLVLNDTTTTTTTVEVFRANADDPNLEYYRLPPPPADSHGLPQLISAHGPSYEVHTDTKTRFSDAPIGYGTPSPALPSLPTTKSVQWDTKEPITILREDDRPESRHGSHGSIDTILRKQWIENKTETLTRAYSPTNQINENYPLDSAPFNGSNRSLLDNSQGPTSYTILDAKNVENRERRELEREYVTRVEAPVKDSRNKYYEKRRLSPHSKSPIRHNEQLANPNQQKASTYISYPIEVPKNRARQDAARAKQVWEYNSHVNRPVGRQSRSGRQTVTATVVEPQKHSYTSSTIPQQRHRNRHRSSDIILQPNQHIQYNVPSQEAAEDFVERPPRQTCITFNKPQVVTTITTNQPVQQRSRSKTPPPITTEYGKPTLVYSPRESNQDQNIEDDYYAKFREDQHRRGRTSSRRSVDLCDRSRSPSPWEWERPESPNYRMGNRSASSNEIFKLYQTRDCFGNVINELNRNRPISQHLPNESQVRSRNGQNRRERPISQHSYQTISQRNSGNLEDVKFDEYNNVRLVADGAKLHIVQEGKV